MIVTVVVMGVRPVCAGGGRDGAERPGVRAERVGTAVLRRHHPILLPA
ncbi:hypothetical protein V5F49_18465 [Xanthobacter sp. V3C-3]